MTPKQFKDTRLRMGLTQEKMAAKIGVSRRAIQHYESGTRKISHSIEIFLDYYEHSCMRILD